MLMVFITKLFEVRPHRIGLHRVYKIIFWNFMARSMLALLALQWRLFTEPILI